MSTAPSPLSLSDFLTSPPPLDLASLPASSSLLARYASSASQHTAGSGSTPAASGGTPSSSAHLAPHPHHFPHDDGGGGGSGGGGRDDAFLDFTLSPGADDQDGFGNNGEGMFGLGQPQQAHQHQHQPPPAQGRQRHQSSLSSSSQPSVPYHTGQQPNGGQQQQSQSQQPLQADLRALFESLGASSADFDLDAASSPSSPAYPHPSQQHSQLVPAHAHQHPHQQPSPGAFQGGPPPAPNGLLELLPQLQQMTAGGALNHAGLGQLQQHLQNQQNQQQHGGGQPMPPDIASLLGLLGVPAFANGNQQQQQQQHGGHSQLNGQGHESAGATIAKLRELQEMQQAQAALIQQQVRRIVHLRPVPTCVSLTSFVRTAFPSVAQPDCLVLLDQRPAAGQRVDDEHDVALWRVGPERQLWPAAAATATAVAARRPRAGGLERAHGGAGRVAPLRRPAARLRAPGRSGQV